MGGGGPQAQGFVQGLVGVEAQLLEAGQAEAVDLELAFLQHDFTTLGIEAEGLGQKP